MIEHQREVLILKKSENGKTRIMISLAILFLSFSIGKMDAKAGTMTVMVDSYSVTNEKVIPGEDFELSLSVTNHDLQETATNVVVNVTNPVGVAPVYGSVSQLYVGDMQPGEQRVVKFQYNSWTTIETDTIDFGVSIFYDQGENSFALRIPSGTDIPFSIMGVSFPESMEVNTVGTAGVAFKVLGETNVQNVELNALVDGVPVTQNLIGILTPGTTKTQTIAINCYETGNHIVSLYLCYSDEYGQEKEIDLGSQTIVVTERTQENNVALTPETYENKNEHSELYLMIAMGLVVIIIVLGLSLLIQRKK